jgi:COP9 signalosome complex subunit 3
LVQALSPSKNTIPFLYVLNALIDNSVSSGKATSRSLPQSVLPNGGLWPHIAAILSEFDPIQVRYAGVEFYKIISIVVSGAEQTSVYTPAIVLLHNAILRLDPTSSTLTSIHYHFIRLCLYAKAYEEAANILDRPIYHIPTSLDKASAARSYQYLCSAEPSLAYLTPGTGLTEKFSHRTYLEYFLYAGVVYIALKRWEPALAALEICLAAPSSSTASMIQIEAYRKFVLVGLLLNGKTPKAPKVANPTAMKNIRAVARAYDCLADAFNSRDPGRFRAEVSEGQPLWSQDCNTGLVLHLFNAFRKYAVIRLGRTFTALSIAEVARRTSNDSSDVDEAAEFVTSLISQGELNAELTMSSDGSGGVLRFLPSAAATKSEAQLQQDLAVQTDELHNILKHISDNDHRLEITKEYIGFLQKLKKQKEQSAKGGAAGQSETQFDDIDEDMMGDI